MRAVTIFVAMMAMAAAEDVLDRAAPTCSGGLAGWTCNSSYKKCYKVGPSLVNWNAAQGYCVSQAPSASTANLAEPSFTNGESSYIRQFLPSRSNPDEQTMWLGVIRQSGSTWGYATTGTQFAQNNISPWGKSQPDWPTTGQTHLNWSLYRSWPSAGFDDGSPAANKFPLCSTPCT